MSLLASPRYTVRTVGLSAYITVTVTVTFTGYTGLANSPPPIGFCVRWNTHHGVEDCPCT